MRLAFVTPRYGSEITTGPEHGCRLLAEQLALRHDVDVLTTRARRDRTWQNEHPEGSDRIRGVLVRRFTAEPGDPDGAHQLAQRLVTTPHSRAEELEWVRRAGPWSPAMLEHLRRHGRNYDALVFFSYRHATTIQGITVAPRRSVLFPWLRLEPLLRLGIARETLEAPSAIGYFSAVERQLLHIHSRNATQRDDVVGIGMQAPPEQSYPRLQQEPADGPEDDAADALSEAPRDWAKPHLATRGAMFRRRHRLEDERLVLYADRVEPNNGCEELLEYFDACAAQDTSLSLVLMGVKMMKVPAERYLHHPGVLLPSERFPALAAADLTLAPEPEDLLAEPVLQSFAVGTPVLANARNTAAVQHCRQANGGLYYGSRAEFVEALKLLTSDARTREALGQSAQAYIRQQFGWDAVIGRLERLVGLVKGR